MHGIRCGVCQEMCKNKNTVCLPLPSLPPQYPQCLISARSAEQKMGFVPGDLFRGVRVTRRCRAARAGLLRAACPGAEFTLLRETQRKELAL